MQNRLNENKNKPAVVPAQGQLGGTACSSWGQDLAPLVLGQPDPGRLVPAPPALGRLGLEPDPGQPDRPAAPAAEPASAAAATADGAVAAASGTAAAVAPRLATRVRPAPWEHPVSVFRQSAPFARERPQPVLAVHPACQGPSAAVQGHRALLAERARTWAAAAEALQPEPRSTKTFLIRILFKNIEFSMHLFLIGKWFFMYLV